MLLLFPIADCSSLSFCLRYLDFGVLTRVFLPDVVPVEPNTSSKNLTILPNPSRPSRAPSLSIVHRPVNLLRPISVSQSIVAYPFIISFEDVDCCIYIAVRSGWCLCRHELLSSARGTLLARLDYPKENIVRPRPLPPPVFLNRRRSARPYSAAHQQ